MNVTAMVSLPGGMEENMRESIEMVKTTARDITSPLMAKNMKVDGKMGRSTARDNTHRMEK